MPVYLLHGFRWPRPAIRIHVIIHNIDDAAPEWLVAPATSRAFLENFRQTFPKAMAQLPHLRFVEQYDPRDETTKSQPYAYVADLVHEVELGADIDEIRQKGIKDEQSIALADLRDQISAGEKITWYVVVCGDEERSYSGLSTPIAETIPRRSNGTWFDDEPKRSVTPSSTQSREARDEAPSARKRGNSLSRGLKKMFGRGERSESGMKDLKNPGAMKSSVSAFYPANPPLPGTAR